MLAAFNRFAGVRFIGGIATTLALTLMVLPADALELSAYYPKNTIFYTELSPETALVNKIFSWVETETKQAESNPDEAMRAKRLENLTQLRTLFDQTFQNKLAFGVWQGTKTTAELQEEALKHVEASAEETAPEVSADGEDRTKSTAEDTDKETKETTEAKADPTDMTAALPQKLDQNIMRMAIAVPLKNSAQSVEEALGAFFKNENRDTPQKLVPHTFGKHTYYTREPLNAEQQKKEISLAVPSKDALAKVEDTLVFAETVGAMESLLTRLDSAPAPTPLLGSSEIQSQLAQLPANRQGTFLLQMSELYNMQSELSNLTAGMGFMKPDIAKALQEIGSTMVGGLSMDMTTGLLSVDYRMPLQFSKLSDPAQQTALADIYKTQMPFQESKLLSNKTVFSFSVAGLGQYFKFYQQHLATDDILKKLEEAKRFALGFNIDFNQDVLGLFDQGLTVGISPQAQSTKDVNFALMLTHTPAREVSLTKLQNIATMGFLPIETTELQLAGQAVKSFKEVKLEIPVSNTETVPAEEATEEKTEKRGEETSTSDGPAEEQAPPKAPEKPFVFQLAHLANPKLTVFANEEGMSQVLDSNASQKLASLPAYQQLTAGFPNVGSLLLYINVNDLMHQIAGGNMDKAEETMKAIPLSGLATYARYDEPNTTYLGRLNLLIPGLKNTP